jgi:hypothetical protein
MSFSPTVEKRNPPKVPALVGVDERAADLLHQRFEIEDVDVGVAKAYLREQRALLSPKNDLAKAIRYVLARWASFTRFLDDGRICLSNNGAERALRCVALFDYIERFYNPKRRHSTIGYLSPMEFERQAGLA